ncbi:MAG: hypothetical protein ACRD2W_20870, partial [Acidimicrobiales bacterium]
RVVVRSWPSPADHAGLHGALLALADEAGRLVGGSAGAEVTTAVDCRYAGQSHEVTVADVDAFPDEHRRRNGYARPGAPIEVVALRATARVPAPLDPGDLPPPDGVVRTPASGPAVIAEPDCTIWVPDGWSADVAPDGSWVLTRAGRRA